MYLVKNCQIFPSQACHFQYDHRPIFRKGKGGTLAVAKRYKWQNLLNLGCQDSIYFGENHLGRVFFSHFLECVPCFNKNFWIFYLVLCHFLMSWSLEDLKYILKNIFSITFSHVNQQRRNMYFEACHCTKNLIFFLQIFWEDSLSKNVALKYNLSCIIRKGDISFS